MTTMLRVGSFRVQWRYDTRGLIPSPLPLGEVHVIKGKQYLWCMANDISSIYNLVVQNMSKIGNKNQSIQLYRLRQRISSVNEKWSSELVTVRKYSGHRKMSFSS